MLFVLDLKQDEAGDLLIENGDFTLEDDGYKAAILTAENRACARSDDFVLDACGAGIETLLYKDLEKTKYDIIYQLTSALKKDGLFDDSDFEIKINTDKDEKTSQVFIKIKSETETSEGFRVIVDQLNQNSYR